MSERYRARFRARLWRYPGKGGWHFVTVPAKYAPRPTHGWGRTPVYASVDGYEWSTSVWRGKDGRTLLAVPKADPGDGFDGVEFLRADTHRGWIIARSARFS